MASSDTTVLHSGLAVDAQLGTEAAVKNTEHGISILKDIFPEHGASTDASNRSGPASGRLPLQLLASLPSPARAPQGGTAQGASLQKPVPYGPPSHAAPLLAPTVPPPPPFSPGPVYQTFGAAAQEQAQMQLSSGVQLMLEPALSYREKLRAGGRGALQRAINAGLVPKNMKQQWFAQQMPAHVGSSSAPPESYQHNIAMPFSMLGDDQVQLNSCWQQAPMHMANFTPAAHSFMPAQMSMTTMSGEQFLPSAQLQDIQVTAPLQSGDSTPTDIDRCMAIVMPQAGNIQFPCDKDMMAAQLQAAADCQRYED
jgi:hypothetical protein